MLKEWNDHYDRIKVFEFALVPDCEQYPAKADLNIIIDDTNIDRKSNYKYLFYKAYDHTHDIHNNVIVGKAKIGEQLLKEYKKVIKDLIEALTVASFIISPKYDTLKKAMVLSTEEAQKMRGLIELVFTGETDDDNA